MSVKALAVSCVGAAAALLPETFFNRLYLEPLDGQQTDGKTLEYVWSIIILKLLLLICCLLLCIANYIPEYVILRIYNTSTCGLRSCYMLCNIA